MSRGFTVAEAAKKECPFRMSNGPDWIYRHCSGAECMLWEWLAAPALSQMVMLPFVEVNGAVVPTIQEQQPGTCPEITDFPAPEGDGWRPSETGPVFRESKGCWTLTFLRETDSERRGVCGAARNGEAA